MNLPKSLINNDKVTLFPEGALGYLVGPTLAMLANSILAGYFNRYMSDVLHVNNWASTFFTWLPVISVAFVVLGNILVGRLMDHLKSNAGKARPLILLSVPISLIALVILFVISPFATDTINTEQQTMALVCIAIGYNLWFALAYPVYSTPHAALVSLSTRDTKDRSLLATISNATALAAMGLTNMILPFFLGSLFVYDMSGNGTAVLNDAGAIDHYVDAGGNILYDARTSYEHWKVFVIALIIITLVGAVIEYFFTRERVTEEGAGEDGQAKAALPIGAQAKICFSDKFWIIMIAFFFFYQLGGMLKNVSQTYFCLAMFAPYTVESGGQIQGLISIIGAIPTAIGMVIAWPLSNKIGKGKAILCGAVVSTLGGILGLLFPTNVTMVIVSFVIKALGSTPAMYLSLALLADVLDHQEALHGARTDGFSMTIYGAIMAGMTGIATGLLNAILAGLNYDISTVASNTALRAAMPWLFIGGETVGYALIFVIFLFMGVEKFSDLDHLAIQMDQGVTPDKDAKPLQVDEKTLEEFNAMRKANGRAEVKIG
ncbi:MAG: MFS transporter [Lachnospiraceae bacterium]|nr:MFS transporter [Lachnospiraceae bacterium]